MLEEVKLDSLVVLVSEKQSLFNNLLTMSLKLMVVTLYLLVSVKEQEKVTIFIMKWSNLVLLKLEKLDQDVLLFMDKWMNPQEPELELD